MARVIAIDYGTKRVGLAVTDDSQIIASALTTIHAKDLLVFLKEYFLKNNVETIVVGKPKRMNNENSDVEKHIINFIKQLTKHFPQMPVVRIDERFTSKMAVQTMIDSGLKKKARQNKETVDQISATIILQSYLERKI